MNPVVLFAGLLGVVVGAVALVHGRRRRHERETIAGTETTDVLSLTPGPAEVVGRAEPAGGGPIRAPFSEADCLVAEWEIEEWEESGKTSSWRSEGSGVVKTPFYVDDGTDRVLVLPAGATFDVSGEDVVEVGADEEPPRPIREFLELESTPGDPNRALISALDWGQQVGDRKYRQSLIRPGDEVYVHGTATRSNAREFGANDYELVPHADDGYADADLFLVANASEQELVDDRGDAVWYLVGGAVALLVGVSLLLVGIVGPL
ncbi:E3 ubiquitin ligase family protein [Halorarius halobius]|uniref:E3 ubiquitin ligase family protein n=1 Tax=Halorarius halobius TaxID=2962671 RepID=UPI0020CC0E45|nr:E3 ubiquitin ligase family protein [Halorarius halobius]